MVEFAPVPEEAKQQTTILKKLMVGSNFMQKLYHPTIMLVLFNKMTENVCYFWQTEDGLMR